MKGNAEDCYMNDDTRNPKAQNSGYRKNGVPQYPRNAGCPRDGSGGGTPTRWPKYRLGACHPAYG